MDNQITFNEIQITSNQRGDVTIEFLMDGTQVSRALMRKEGASIRVSKSTLPVKVVHPSGRNHGRDTR
jgi:hypothetical protein